MKKANFSFDGFERRQILNFIIEVIVRLRFLRCTSCIYSVVLYTTCTMYQVPSVRVIIFLTYVMSCDLQCVCMYVLCRSTWNLKSLNPSISVRISILHGSLTSFVELMESLRQQENKTVCQTLQYAQRIIVYHVKTNDKVSENESASYKYSDTQQIFIKLICNSSSAGLGGIPFSTS